MANTMPKTWQNIRPFGEWLVVKQDPRKMNYGGIILTQELTGVERVGYCTGRILRAGEDAAKRMALAMGTELVGRRVMHREYLKDVWAFGNLDEDRLPIYLIHANEIMAFVPDDLEVTSL